MNHLDVQLIGVFDCVPPMENFCYSVNLPAPHNLWVGALCEDGTRMGSLFMGYVLNELIEADAWNEGQGIEMIDQSGTALKATVGMLVDKSFVEAFASKTPGVRLVSVGPLS